MTNWKELFEKEEKERLVRKWKRENPDLTKTQVRVEIEKIILDVPHFDHKNRWHKYSEAKHQLNRFVGWMAEYPYFTSSEDWEAAMRRVVIALDIDDNYGRSRNHKASEITFPLVNEGA